MADKISIAMCTYNGERYLRDQLASIAAQTRPPDELVVCDDRSTDATCEIVTGFSASASFPVRLHVNERNVGSTKNFERAIRLCEGDVIALSDQDDVWLPEKLRRIEGCLLRNAKVGLVFTDAEVVDEDLQPLGYSLWESIGFDNSQRRLVRTGRVLDVLLPGSTVAGATMAFRSGFKNLVLEIPTNLALIHDGWIALMIASVADVSFIEEPLIKYRQHARQQIGARQTDEAGVGVAGLDGIKEAMRRTTSYQEMIEIATQAHHRLTEQRDIYKSDDALSRLEDRLEHLRARSYLPEGKLSRVRFVIGELLSRRYHLYSNGFRSAVKDLFA
ncbi:MAG: glycosyltransferase family 2 protein [Pyrinomonadaceae bacterium]|nr:glycosyltransferase family 2 protein [Pyrinomonadaceae bacterium]MBA3768602.1 glycosyltransferase family 2 protein [Acidobacteriota bacterium]